MGGHQFANLAACVLNWTHALLILIPAAVFACRCVRESTA